MAKKDRIASAARKGLEVHACAKERARSGQDGDPHICVRLDLIERRADGVADLGVDRVALVGAVQRDRRDPVFDVVKNDIIAHFRLPFRRAFAGRRV